MKKKLKIKKQAKKKLIIFILIIIISVGGFKLFNDYLYRQTYEYKLLQINYSLNEIKIIEEEFNDKQIDTLLTKEYNPNLTKIISDKYFIYNNLNRYLNYYNENKDIDLNKVISLINVNRDNAFYEKPIKTNYKDEKLMLVNKYYYLDKDYEPENIITTTGTYSYANNSLNEETYNAYQELYNAAKIDGHTILIVSSYRNFEYQEELWNERKELYGTRKADEYAARAGHSEHQTGYAVDVADFYDVNDKFGDTESYIWMKENAHKYGFILRYPKDKEDITGYSYEPWHYRYVGKEIANKIYQENITFDEYYAYYLDKEVN
ncbi:MAG: M15 family metallopeptidase [Bacilli bacterium]|nr:M15 family metallopeptidase [Bacilli bacterium]MDD4407160.1 M15 family metallopeptidase [Bacilli bacterium]